MGMAEVGEYSEGFLGVGTLMTTLTCFFERHHQKIWSRVSILLFIKNGSW